VARYTQADKLRAISALRAAAKDGPDGELVPPFRQVARLEGMPSRTTLIKWWDEREVDQDCTRAATLQRAKDAAPVQGAVDWLTTQHQACKEVAEYILDPMHRRSDEQHQRTPPHQMARALKDLLPALTQLNDALNGTNTANSTPATRAAAAMRRTMSTRRLAPRAIDPKAAK